MSGRRALLCALLALSVPLPAFALDGGGEEAPRDLGVSISLDDCGILENQVVCRFDATYSPIEGASAYSASITRPDGSVVDLGAVSGGAASFWVPYAGDGTYTIQISAWGESEGEKPEVIAKDRAKAAGEGDSSRHGRPPAVDERGVDEPTAPNPSGEGADTVKGDGGGKEPAPSPDADGTAPLDPASGETAATSEPGEAPE